MLPSTRSLCTAAALVGACGLAASAGTMTKDLETRLAGMPADQRIRVVITMADQASEQDIGAITAFGDKAIQRQVVVDLLQDVAARSQGPVLDILQAAEGRGEASRITPLWIYNVIGAEVTPAVARELAGRADIDEIAAESMAGADVLPFEPGNESPLAAITCGVNLIKAPQVWSTLNITGRGVVAAVIDTGTCITHPDLRNQIWRNPNEIAGNGIDDDGNGFRDDINGWNFESNNANVGDSNGHGTHVAGTVGGDGTNGTTTGVAPDVKIMTTKFFNNVSQAGETSVWNSMQYAVRTGADLTTASLGWAHSWNPNRRVWRETCENTIAAGLVVLYAAGNEGTCCGIDSVRTPGDVPDVITVGAVDCNDNIASFSSRGPVTWQNIPPFNDWPYPPGKMKPTISAPGVDTVSTSSNCSGYLTLSGTSMATPHTAGVVALILEANPRLSHAQVREILEQTSIDRGSTGYDNSYGAGRIDALAAVTRAIATRCPADWNGDGSANSDDFFDFLNSYYAGNADFNRDGSTNSDDFFDFLNAYYTGC